MHNTLSPASLPPALTARLSLYGARRRAYIAHIPFPETARVRMARAVDTEVKEAEAAILKQPEPVARLRAELLFWTDFYERDAQDPTPSDPDEDPGTKETEARWAKNSLAVFRQATELLDWGEHAKAFRVLADMHQNPDQFGPVPDPLDLTGARWLDLPPTLLPPGHSFLDEQSESAVTK